MPAPGNVWAADTWDVNAWAADTWADASEAPAGDDPNMIYTAYHRRGMRMWWIVLAGLIYGNPS